jgi:hypothetical protein
MDNTRVFRMSFAGVYPHHVEEIKNKLMQQIRYLDKLAAELAKGKAMDKILRK